MSRYKLTIQYDGTYFFGWQLQPNKRTVQGEVEKALMRFMNTLKRIPIHGSGRTDTGVHAIAQVAHSDFECSKSENVIKNAMNSFLDKDCHIMHVEKVSENFHARFNAISRKYRYQIYTGKSIFYRSQAWYLKIDGIEGINSISKYLLGDHDFLSFSKFQKHKENTICTIIDSEWKVKGDFINFFIVGNRFLHHMVRYLVGTIIMVNQNKKSLEEFSSLLDNPQKNAKVSKAPPCGLFLEKVSYELSE